MECHHQGFVAVARIRGNMQGPTLSSEFEQFGTNRRRETKKEQPQYLQGGFFKPRTNLLKPRMVSFGIRELTYDCRNRPKSQSGSLPE